MEVLVDGWGYMVSIDSPNGELDTLKNKTLEGEILSTTDEKPYTCDNPTGKKLTLRIDPNVRDISVSYYPENSGWEDLQRIDVRISPEDYKNIYLGSGRVRGAKPTLSIDILVQDTNAV
ncbi:MAG: hypothetical protein Q7S74_00890 [Nanoarchaeota archaeon]|nr:hypothetical protein [Nanoarchaeota archaeon]